MKDKFARVLRIPRPDRRRVRRVRLHGGGAGASLHGLSGTRGRTGVECPPSSARQFPTSSSNSAPLRPISTSRPSSISVLDSSGQASRVRPKTSAAPRGVSSFSPERDVAIFAPRSYDESRRITDLLRSNRAVVLNVNSVDPNLVVDSWTSPRARPTR